MSSTKVSSIVNTNRVMSTKPVLVTVKEPVSNVESPETVTCAEPVAAVGVVPTSLTLPQFDSNGAAEPEVDNKVQARALVSSPTLYSPCKASRRSP
jgi:hypothetical protein